MADNVTLWPMSGGAVVATDQADNTTHVQIVKLGEDETGSSRAIPASVEQGLLVNAASRGRNLIVGQESVGFQVPVPMSQGNGYIPEQDTCRSILIQNNGPHDVYVAGDAYAAYAHGIELKVGRSMVIDKAPRSPIYISRTSTEAGDSLVNWMQELD